MTIYNQDTLGKKIHGKINIGVVSLFLGAGALGLGSDLAEDCRKGSIVDAPQNRQVVIASEAYNSARNTSSRMQWYTKDKEVLSGFESLLNTASNNYAMVREKTPKQTLDLLDYEITRKSLPVKIRDSAATGCAYGFLGMIGSLALYPLTCFIDGKVRRRRELKEPEARAEKDKK